MTLRTHLVGHLDNCPAPPSGFSDAAGPLLRTLIVDTGMHSHGVPTRHYYHLSPGDGLVIRDGGVTLWSGHFAGEWCHPDVEAVVWDSYFDRHLAAEVTRATPVFITEFGEPKDVPLDLPEESVRSALGLFQSLCSGQIGFYELKAADRDTDPVILLFLLDAMVATSNLGPEPSKAARQIVRAMMSGDAFDRPKWVEEAKLDPVSIWFRETYDMEQFFQREEMGIRILLGKILS